MTTAQTIAITGGSGYIGGNLAHALAQQGNHIKLLVRKQPSNTAPTNMTYIQGDLADTTCLDKLCADTDIVFHTAAKIAFDPRQAAETHAVNIQGTHNIINACFTNKIKRLIHFSSIAAIQTPTKKQATLDETYALVNEDAPYYSHTKAQAEHAIQQAVARGLDAIILAPGAVLGPNDSKPSMIGKMLLSFYQQRLIWVLPGGYSWVDVRDVVNTAINSIHHGKTGEKYLLAGTWMSFADLAKLVAAITQRRTQCITIPPSLAKCAVPFATAYSKLTNTTALLTRDSLQTALLGNPINTAKAEQELGHNIRPLYDTLQSTYTWFKQHQLIT